MNSDCCHSEIEIAGTGLHGWCTHCWNIVLTREFEPEARIIDHIIETNKKVEKPMQTSLFEF